MTQNFKISEKYDIGQLICTPELSDAERAWLNILSQVMDLGIIIYDKDLKITFFNKKVCRLTNVDEFFPADDIPSDYFMRATYTEGAFGKTSLSEAEYIKMHRERLKKFIAGEDTLPLNEIVRTRLGVSGEIYRIRLANSSGVAILVRDLTTQTIQDEGMKAALRNASSGFLRYTLETQNIKVWDTYLKTIMTDSEYERFLADGIHPFLHHKDIKDAMLAWEKTIETGETVTCYPRLVFSDGVTRQFKFVSSAQYSSRGEVVSIICLFMDVSADYKIKQELESARTLSENSLQSKSNFIAGLAHEIRTPMNAIVGMSEAILQNSVEPKIRKKLELIQSATERLVNTFDALLEHSQLELQRTAINPALCNIKETIEHICSIWRPRAAASGIHIRFHASDDVPECILVDKFRYEQCLNNILSNAIKFTPDGFIDVVLTCHTDSKSHNHLVLAIKDTGIGMTEDQQKRIFLAYTQAHDGIKQHYGGVGLGMNITKNIIELMDGTVSVVSKLGEGTTFLIKTPLRLVDQKEDDVSGGMTNELDGLTILDQLFDSEVVPETPYSNLNILVVDDNATNHVILESLLETVVNKLYYAQNGQEALEVLAAEDIDIVYMDIHMPVMDGIEATLKIRNSSEKWSDVFIVALTADPQFMQLRLCRNIGIDETLPKPIKLASLMKTLDNILETKRTGHREYLRIKTAS